MDTNSMLKQELMLIKPSNKAIYKESKGKWDSIAKPINGLGRLETFVSEICSIRENVDANIRKKCAIIMCADNGVVCEGISQTDESVTLIVANNLANGMANVNLMSSLSDTVILPVNIGMKEKCENKGVFNKCIINGTGNIANGPAMTRVQCEKAILAGIDMVKYAKNEGFDIIATGEMGIGNTTTSSAIASLLLNTDPVNVTGKGAGLSNEGLANKIRVIKKAIEVNKPDATDPIDMISKVGGLDIAGMTGLFLGGAIHHIPIVIDGLISTVSAILAVMLAKDTKDYMLPSHSGREPACIMLNELLGVEPVIYADLALGEGTGAVSLFPLLDMAYKVYSQDIRFEDINMEAYKPL